MIQCQTHYGPLPLYRFIVNPRSTQFNVFEKGSTLNIGEHKKIRHDSGDPITNIFIEGQSKSIDLVTTKSNGLWIQIRTKNEHKFQTEGIIGSNVFHSKSVSFSKANEATVDSNCLSS